jgi:predicted transcriptional regulator
MTDTLKESVFSTFVGRNVDEVVDELTTLGGFPIIRKVEEGVQVSSTELRYDRLRVFYRGIDGRVTRVKHG